MAREGSRRDLVFGWVRLDPDHEAAIRFKGKAPGRRAHSVIGAVLRDFDGVLSGAPVYRGSPGALMDTTHPPPAAPPGAG